MNELLTNKPPLPKLYEPKVFVNYEDLALELGISTDTHKFIEQYERTLNGFHQENIDTNKNNHDKPLAEQRAVCYNNIGSVYLSQGDYKKSEEYYNKALEIYNENRRIKTDLNVATVYHNLGWMFIELGQLKKAFGFCEKALKIRTKLLEDIVHPDIAISYNNIGVIYLQQGNPQKALEFNERALKMRRELYHDKPHPFLAESYCNKGAILGDLYRYAEALEALSKAEHIGAQFYGEVHRELALNINNQGCLYFRLGKDYEALQYYYKALSIYSKLNIRCLQTGIVFESLGYVLQKKKDLESSRKNLARAYQIYLKSGGKDNQGTRSLSHALEDLERESALTENNY